MKNIILFIITTIILTHVNLGYSQNPTPANQFKNVISKTIHSMILNEDREVYIYS